MTDIEKVARAMCRADPEVRMGDADGVVEQRVNIEWVHYVDQAKAAIAAMQPAPQWQGIESAPVWQEVLVYQKEASKRKSNKTGVITAVLMENGEWTLGAGGRRVANFLRPSPTHWMPLPTPPAGGSDAE